MDDKVFVRVAPHKHFMRFSRKGKLVISIMRPFEVLECVGKIVYRFALRGSMDHIHSVFHVSLLYKYISELIHVLRVQDVKLEDNLV